MFSLANHTMERREDLPGLVVATLETALGTLPPALLEETVLLVEVFGFLPKVL